MPEHVMNHLADEEGNGSGSDGGIQDKHGGTRGEGIGNDEKEIAEEDENISEEIRRKRIRTRIDTVPELVDDKQVSRSGWFHTREKESFYCSTQESTKPFEKSMSGRYRRHICGMNEVVHGLYGRHYYRWKSCHPHPDHILFLQLEHLLLDPLKFFQKVSEHLGIGHSHEDDHIEKGWEHRLLKELRSSRRKEVVVVEEEEEDKEEKEEEEEGESASFLHLNKLSAAKRVTLPPKLEEVLYRLYSIDARWLQRQGVNVSWCHHANNLYRC
tara:strand:+ start:409 stop:1218 length:810 start_codon:yes stop_codon:yes gene_type:complete